jgi:hypothetical protein
MPVLIEKKRRRETGDKPRELHGVAPDHFALCEDSGKAQESNQCIDAISAILGATLPN